jgi:hypothetical protein
MPVPPLPVWLDCSLPLAAGLMMPYQRDIAAAELRRCCRGVGVTVETDPPADLQPGSFVSCRVWTTRVVPWRSGAGGTSPTHLSAWADLSNHCWCYAGWTGDPLTLGRAAAHEAVGHMLSPPAFLHAAAGLFASPPSGIDFTPEDVKLRNDWLPGLVCGRRVLSGSPAFLHRTNLDWQLPVFAPGQLIFESGPPLTLESLPRGWLAKDWGVDAGGKTVLDFAAKTAHVADPSAGYGFGPASGSVVFRPGAAAYPEWGPEPGWCNVPGSGPLTGGKVEVSHARRTTYVP